MRVEKEDIAFSEIKKVTEERKSAFVRCVLLQSQEILMSFSQALSQAYLIFHQTDENILHFVMMFVGKC